MHKLRYYIIHNLSGLFLSIFLPLFVIASMIFMIKLATYTAIIQLSAFDMIKLYLFVLPEMLFYTLPITFFIVSVLTLFKLSNENEMIVIFSLGVSPKDILKIFLTPAILLGLLLAFDFFVLFPHSTVLSSNFISYKKSEAKFNLKASEFGNKFGHWLLYIGKNNKDGSFGNVFLFNREKKDELLIGAKKAKVINQNGILRLKLYDGHGYSYTKTTLSQIDFQSMIINNMMSTHLQQYLTPLEYWKSKNRADSKKHMMITDVLISLFPIISLFLVLSLGVLNTRHNKVNVYLYIFLAILIYYSSVIGLINMIGYYTIPTVILIWIISTYLIYKKVILSRF